MPSLTLPSASAERDAVALSAVRSRGEVRLGFASGPRGTALIDAYQSGCLRARLPRGAAGGVLETVLLNTGGGLTGGDRLVQSIHWAADTRAGLTSQAAEKVYRAQGDDPAHVSTQLSIDARAEAEWLPQETILFDGARLVRDTQVTIADDGHFLGIEAVVLGRAAMGETMTRGLLDDRWRIRRGAKLIYADALRLDGAIDRRMARAAVGAGARAMAVIIHVSARAAGLLAGVRDALGGAAGTIAASAWNGMLVVRLLARDGAMLRHDLTLALAALRGHRPLPRVWSC